VSSRASDPGVGRSHDGGSRRDGPGRRRPGGVEARANIDGRDDRSDGGAWSGGAWSGVGWGGGGWGGGGGRQSVAEGAGLWSGDPVAPSGDAISLTGEPGSAGGWS